MKKMTFDCVKKSFAYEMWYGFILKVLFVIFSPSVIRIEMFHFLCLLYISTRRENQGCLGLRIVVVIEEDIKKLNSFSVTDMIINVNIISMKCIIPS